MCTIFLISILLFLQMQSIRNRKNKPLFISNLLQVVHKAILNQINLIILQIIIQQFLMCPRPARPRLAHPAP